MMKILYDDQAFSWQKIGGVSRYLVEVQSHLPSGFEVRNSTVFSDNHYVNQSDNRAIARRGLMTFDFPLRNKIMRTVNRASSKRLLRDGRFDLFHPTYYNPYFLSLIGERPFVITVHDMIHEVYGIDANGVANEKRMVVEAATRVIAVSENTKRDLVRFLGVDPDRIDVIYHGHSIDVATTVAIEGLPDRYVLFVGGRDGYKNFENFARAFAVLTAQFDDLQMICTGRQFSVSQLALLEQLGIAGRARAMFVEDRHLPYLYSCAAAFVFPSKYEGFGIPILEAWACRCPVVLSAASCFEEIAADAGLYFDPDDPRSIAEQLARVLQDEQLSDHLVKAGERRVELFSWQSAARQTAELYGEVINGRR